MADLMQTDVDYLVIGAGPAGLQLAYYLEQSGVNYLVIEAGQSAGEFFRAFPRHGKLISINKPNTGGKKAEVALRYDWNSLLCGDESLRFTSYSRRYLPPAEELTRYLADFAAEFSLKVRYGVRVSRVEKTGRFEVFTECGSQYAARRLIVATGLSQARIPPIPGIEHAEQYSDYVTDPETFTDQRVLVIGKGNSAFEVAESLTDSAATIHLASPSPVRFAWQSRYVGHLRAVNNNFLDTYHLKSQNAILDAEVTRIERCDDRYLVSFLYTHANGERIKKTYDRVIACTGFRFDDSLFAASCRPALCHDGRYPAQTSSWESVNVPGLFFAGTLMHARDYRKTMSGFIHGFRYNVRFLADLLGSKESGRPLPSQEVSISHALTDLVLSRINTSSAMFLQPGYLGDVFTVDEDDGCVRHYRDIPIDYVFDSELSAGRWYSVTLEYGPEAEDPFNIERDTDPAWAKFAPFLHPVIRGFRGTTEISQLHLLEDLENEYTVEKCGRLLSQFLDRELGHFRRRFDRAVQWPSP
ncbi:NAD(P)-binding domain-containing protein [Streptomyces sp. NPDC015127]|uniref:NAD(P)-binding domain-containing protein n=1 Tax=Streptomyces sp. NPDC015127 TaxID=3364939 RepID=UPI0036F4EB65